MVQTPVGAAEYYDAFPSSDHQPGDIWNSFPTHGILSLARTAALVITPACDLANRKVETITYLPIVPIADYLCSRSFLSELMKAIEGQSVAAGAPLVVRPTNSPLPPLVADVEAAEAMLAAHTVGKLGAKETAAANRAIDGLFLARGLLTGVATSDRLRRARSLFGERDFDSLAKRLVTNSHRPDVHFLPADGQPPQWAAVPVHSVVLFRYPLSLPIDLLDLSICTSPEGWKSAAAGMSLMHPCGLSLAAHQPIKMLRVRPRFISDLLTRFTGLYGRLGSPDFTADTVDRYTRDIAEAQ